MKREPWLKPGDVIIPCKEGAFIDADDREQLFPHRYDYCTIRFNWQLFKSAQKCAVTVLKALYVEEHVMIASTVELGNVLIHRNRITRLCRADHIDQWI